MKKIQYLLGLALGLTLTAGITSCEDVPAPYELNFEETDNTSSNDSIGKYRETPYGVAEAIKAQASGTTGNVWLKGYIVGYIPTGGETSTTISNTVFGVPSDEMKSNIVLAASADEQVTSNCMSIQLPVGEIRDSLNLSDHAENLGMEVLMYGSLEKYFGAAGLKSVSYAEYDEYKIGKDPDSVQINFEHITIKEFLEKKDTKVAYELTGVATSLNATYASFDLTEDGSTVYIYKMVDKDGNTASLETLNISEGDTVTVTGVYLAYTDKSGNVKDEINPATFVSVKKAPVQTDIEHITIGEFLSKKDASTKYELTGVVKNIANATYGNFDLVDGNDSIYIYGLLTAEGASKQFASMGIEEGDTLTLVGAYKDYNGKAEIANAKFVSLVKGNGNGGTETPVGDGITFDFTSNTWGLPEGSENGLTAAAEYSNGTYTITLAASEGYKYYFNTKNYLMIGKEGAYLTLPKFDFAVARIDVEGTSSASAAVLQNIFVGETAVSTQTAGAKDVTNKYEIAEAYQAAGNQYTLKVLSAQNTQISKITVYKKSE
ncbi:MAG: DUF6359 domain-containing protein [Bacteroidales bacterium]|nr:DUF6359 domain-containing protein [Bacteroidales bacterium]